MGEPANIPQRIYDPRVRAAEQHDQAVAGVKKQRLVVRGSDRAAPRLHPEKGAADIFENRSRGISPVRKTPVITSVVVGVNEGAGHELAGLHDWRG